MPRFASSAATIARLPPLGAHALRAAFFRVTMGSIGRRVDALEQRQVDAREVERRHQAASRSQRVLAGGARARRRATPYCSASSSVASQPAGHRLELLACRAAAAAAAAAGRPGRRQPVAEDVVGRVAGRRRRTRRRASRSGCGGPRERAVDGRLLGVLGELAGEARRRDAGELARPPDHRQRARQLAAPVFFAALS